MIIAVVLSLVCMVSMGHGAPAAGANPLLAQQFVVLTPPHQVAHHYQPLEYEPVPKLDQPLFQQITPLGRIETPQKQQLLLLYPNGPLTQYPLISLRQDAGGAGGNGDFWQSIQNFFQNIGNNFGATPEAPPPASGGSPVASGGGADAIKSAATLYAAQPIAAVPEAPVLTPASTVPLTEKRYYIISGQPQFYGKYNALQTPLNSVFHLQPLHALDARSAAPTGNPAATVAEEGAAVLSAAQAELSQLSAAIGPVQVGVPLQLRSAYEAPLQAFEPVAIASPQPAAPSDSADKAEDDAVALREAPAAAISTNSAAARSVTLLNAAQQPEANAEAQQLVGWSRDEPVLGGVSDGHEEDEDIVARSSNDQSTDALAAEDSPEEEQQPSVAHARPTGIALAGKGGLASSKPSATALVGDGGLAMASPVATAISGEFSDDEAKDEQGKELLLNRDE